MKKYSLSVSLGIVLLFFVLLEDAYAYVDPSVGGYLFQILFVIFSACLGVMIAGKEKVLKLFLVPFRAMKAFLKKISQSSK